MQTCENRETKMPPGSHQGFTMAEMLVSMAASVLIILVILACIPAMSKTFVATEGLSIARAAQMRLLDSVAMDLRNTTKIIAPSPALTTVSSTFTGISPSTSGTLTLRTVGYYQNDLDVSGTQSISQQLQTNTLVYDGNFLEYASVSGSTHTLVSGTVQYYKANSSKYGTMCYFRKEGSAPAEEIAENADGMLLALKVSSTIPMLSSSSRSVVQVKVLATPTFSKRGVPDEPSLSGTDNALPATDWVMLRNSP